MKTRITFFRSIIYGLLVFALFQTSSSFAQVRVNAYTWLPFTGSFTTIVGQGGTTYLGLVNNISGTTGISMPFSYIYDGTTYPSGSTLWINSGGSVNFGSGIGTYYSRIVPYFSGSASSYPSTIAAMSGLQYIRSGVYYNVTGSAPNRVLTVEYSNAQDYWSTANPLVSYQIKLFETTNMIEFWYSQHGAALGGSQPTYYHNVGLNGGTSPSFVQNILVGGTTNFKTPNSNYRVGPLPNVQLAVSVKAVSYGTLFTGTSSDYSIRISHVGTQSTLNVNTAAIGGVNPADFTIISPTTPPTGIPVGGFVDYVVRFSPLNNGNRSATLTFVTNGRDSGTQSVNLFGSGVAPVISATPKILFKGSKIPHGDTVEQSIVISSLSQASLYFSSFDFSGDGAGDYVVSRMPMNPLPGGMVDTLKVKFTPMLEGGRPAVLTINNNSINEPSVAVTLKGIGIIPRIEVASSFLDHDSTNIGITDCKKITIYNTGSDSLRIKDHYFASADGDFSFTPLTGQKLVVPPNDSVKVDVCFTPLQRGTRQARFRIHTNIPMTFEQYPRDTSYVDVDIRANGVPLDKSIIVQKDVSDVIVGAESGSTLEFTNVGTEPVVVTKPIISGANASEFSISKVNFPLTVAPGASVNMTLISKPMARGERSANVLFNLSSEGRKFTTSTDVKANALLACASSSVSSLNFDKLVIGESSANVFEISNCGDIEQVFSATLSGSDAYSLDATSVVVPAGAKTNLSVSFMPKAEGVATAMLTLKGSHINDISVNMSGVGEKKPVTQSVGRTSEMEGFVLEQNAPNPALGYTNISFTAPKMATVRIYLADMTGKMVKEVANGNYSSGSHSVTLDTKDLSSGSYIYILESNNVRLTRQMVVTK